MENLWTREPKGLQSMDFQSWTQTHTVYHLELEEEKQSRKNGFKDKNSILRTETYGKLEPP